MDNEGNKFWDDYVSRYIISAICWFRFEKKTVHDQGLGGGYAPSPETSPMPFPQPLSRSSLVYLLVWGPVLRTPYIFSPNHYLLLATHGNNVATCFAEVPRLSFIPNLSHLSSMELEVPPHCLSLQARSHFDVTYFIAHNCCTTSLGTSKYLLLA